MGARHRRCPYARRCCVDDGVQSFVGYFALHLCNRLCMLLHTFTLLLAARCGTAPMCAPCPTCPSTPRCAPLPSWGCTASSSGLTPGVCFVLCTLFGALRRPSSSLHLPGAGPVGHRAFTRFPPATGVVHACVCVFTGLRVTLLPGLLGLLLSGVALRPPTGRPRNGEGRC